MIKNFNEWKQIAQEKFNERYEIVKTSPYSTSVRERLGNLHNKFDIEWIFNNDPFMSYHILQSINDNRSYPEITELNLNAYFKYFKNNLNKIEEIVNDKINKAKEIENKILNLDLSKKRLDLEEHIIIKKKGKDTKVLYDFCPITHAIEDAYGFETRGMFDSLRYHKDKSFLNFLGFTEEECDDGRKVAPTTGNQVAIIYCMLAIYDSIFTIDLIPYVDHWHYLLDNDFAELKRGGTNYFSLYVENEDPLFAKIRQIYTLECDKHDDGYILFEVDW